MGKLLRNFMAIATSLALAAGSVSNAVMAEPISSGFKQGWEKVTNFFKPPPAPAEPANDAVSLSSPAKPGPDLYVATARVYEQSGRLDLAEKQYKLGLRIAPKHLGLQLGYARLKDRQGNLDEAIKLYQDVGKTHPAEAAVHNDMGLCYARHGKLREAVASLERAAAMQPQRKLYRNNLATVLVDAGQIDAALGQLRAVYGEAVASYNLGYLLQKKGEPRVAVIYFAQALEKDPTLTAARVWLDRLTDAIESGPQLAPPGGRPPLPSRSAMPPAGPSGTPPAVPSPSGPWTMVPGSVAPRPQMSAQGRPPGPPRPLPSAEYAPPSPPGQSPADVSVPIPGGPAFTPSPTASASPNYRLSRRPYDPVPRSVQPLPPVEEAPLPPK